jgi:hypothetical protein
MKHIKSFHLITESNNTKVFYNFENLPTKQKWSDDYDRLYDYSFFDDKEFDEYKFDNFKDMDAAVGHPNSLFGTKGLEPGDPHRTSRSFDMYNSNYGPCVVRILK